MRYLQRIFVEGKNTKLIGVITWKILADYMFADIVTDVYAYMNQIADYNYVKLVISWITLLVFYSLGEKIYPGMVKFSYDFLFIFSFIPTLTVWWVKNENDRCMILIILYWFVWWIVSAYITRIPQYRAVRHLEQKELCYIRDKQHRNVNERINIGAIVIAFAFCSIATLYFSYKYGSMRLFIGFGEVYDYRNVEGNSMSSIEGYIYNWMVSIVLPMILLFLILKKKYILAIISALLISMNYAIYGNKAMLFMIVLAVCLAIINKIDLSRYLTRYCLLGVNVVTFVSCILQNTGITLWGVALMDRMTTGIAAAHFYYYDFFQTNEFLYLRQSIFRFFTSSPYDKAVSIIIGSSAKYNLSGVYNNQNNGVFSDAYANFGIVGVLVYPILYVCSIYFFEKVLKDVKPSYKYLMLCYLLLYCMSTGYFQWILSGGFIIVIILLRTYKKYRV